MEVRSQNVLEATPLHMFNEFYKAPNYSTFINCECNLIVWYGLIDGLVET